MTRPIAQQVVLYENEEGVFRLEISLTPFPAEASAEDFTIAFTNFVLLYFTKPNDNTARH